MPGTESRRAAEQAIFAGAQDAGVRIVGISTSGEHETVLASGDDGPVEIGERTTVTVRVAADGTLLPRREDSDTSTPPATSILEIDVIPSTEIDANGDEQVVWAAYAKQYDVDTARAIATSASTPKEVDPSAAAEQMAGSAAEAVTKALSPLVSGGKMNVGELDPLPAQSSRAGRSSSTATTPPPRPPRARSRSRTIPPTPTSRNRVRSPRPTTPLSPRPTRRSRVPTASSPMTTMTGARPATAPPTTPTRGRPTSYAAARPRARSSSRWWSPATARR